MSSSPEYWIWLQRTLGAGKRFDNILMYFDTPEKLYNAGKKAWLQSGVMDYKTAGQLAEYSPSQSYKIMEQCKRNGWSIVTLDDEYYPPLLKEIYGYPPVLYVMGDPAVLSSPVCLSMVGTRNASEYGVGVAASLSGDLARAGAVIVSGGALGIDSAAHWGALRAGGKTIAVLGCGLGHSYLAANEEMRRCIAENGAVVSEFTPYSAPTRNTFPVRNRIISGMTLGTVVVEAGEKSGSLITARFAAEQGRDVFAVPGDITSSNYFGTNSLIRDGARAVFSYMDVLDGYAPIYGKHLRLDDKYKPVKAQRKNSRPAPMRQTSMQGEIARQKAMERSAAEQAEKETKPQPTEKEALPDFATAEAKKLYEAIQGEPKTADEYVIITDMPVSGVLSALTELEMYGIVEMYSGKRYGLKMK